MDITKLTVQELREVAELTAHIKRDLDHFGDLELLQKQLSGIVAALASIQDSDIDLEWVEGKSGTAIASLNAIEAHDLVDDVDDLATSTSQIVGNLNVIEAHNVIGDVADLLNDTNQIVGNLNIIESAR